MDEEQEYKLGMLLGLVSLSMGINKYILNKKVTKNTTTFPLTTTTTTFPLTTTTTTFPLTTTTLPATTLPSTTHPNIFLDQNDINSIISRVNTSPWNTAYNQLITKADAALSLSLQSVTYGWNPTGWNIHDFWDNGSSTHDDDYIAAQQVSRAVRDLGLAYVLTSNQEYAKKSIQLIFNWAIQNETKMNPILPLVDGDSRFVMIDIFTTITAMFYGADLIWNYNDPTFGWNKTYNGQTYKNLFISWITNIINDAKTQCSTCCYGCQNINDFLTTFVASGASLIEDTPSLNWAWDRWKYVVSTGGQINSNCYMAKEILRPNGLSYSTFAMEALIATAEIAKHHSVNLYDYKYNNNGLECVCDKYAPYLITPSTWPYTQSDSPYTGQDYQLYELAYTRYKTPLDQKTSYKDVINKYGRPSYENKIMGPLTLTHGLSFT